MKFKILFLFFSSICFSQKDTITYLKDVVVVKNEIKTEKILKNIKKSYQNKYKENNDFLYKAEVKTTRNQEVFFDFNGSLFLKKQTPFSCDAQYFTDKKTSDSIKKASLDKNKMVLIMNLPNYLLPLNAYDFTSLLKNITFLEFFRKPENYIYHWTIENETYQIHFIPKQTATYKVKGTIVAKKKSFNLISLSFEKNENFILEEKYYKGTLFQYYQTKERQIDDLKLSVSFATNEKQIYAKTINSNLSFTSKIITNEKTNEASDNFLSKAIFINNNAKEDCLKTETIFDLKEMKSNKNKQN